MALDKTCPILCLYFEFAMFMHSEVKVSFKFQHWAVYRIFSWT